MLERPRSDFNERPFVVVWEPTRACDLACLHCRTSEQPRRSSFELTTEEGYKLLDQIAELEPHSFVLTGGDPLKRPDIFNFVEYAHLRGLNPSLTPSSTQLLTDEAIMELKYRRLSRIELGLDGATAATHDSFRGTPGSFDLTLRAIRTARSVGMPVQINTMVARRTIGEIERLVDLLQSLDIVLWQLYFLIPTGRAASAEMITAQEVEEVFARLHDAWQRVSFDIDTTEAAHYRRFVLQQKVAAARAEAGPNADIDVATLLSSSGAARLPFGITSDGISRVPRGVNDARGSVFISHLGEVYPSAFLPLSAGNVRRRCLADIYRESPLFVALRDASLLKGKCGLCDYREICGGSRARAYAMSGDPLGEEPLCIYVPERRPAAIA